MIEVHFYLTSELKVIRPGELNFYFNKSMKITDCKVKLKIPVLIVFGSN
jgi:hypothetical protein